MGMRRAQHEGIGLTRAVDVVEVAAATGDEAPILDAANRLTDAELLHETLPPIRISEARIGFATPRGHGLTGNCSRPVSRSPVCPPCSQGESRKKLPPKTKIRRIHYRYALIIRDLRNHFWRRSANLAGRPQGGRTTNARWSATAHLVTRAEPSHQSCPHLNTPRSCRHDGEGRGPL